MRRHRKSQPALFVLLPTPSTTFPANMLPNKMAPDVAANIPKNLPFLF